CIVQLSFKISGDTVGANFGFNTGEGEDNGGHVCEVDFDIRHGAQVLKRPDIKLSGDGDETLTTSDWKAVRDQWYLLMIEARGAELVIQGSGGPTLVARHPRIAVEKSWFNLKTRGGGRVAYRDISIWKGEAQPQWETTRARLMAPEK